MVRGNWQKRVETADARRRENKQRKLRSQEKKAYKQLSQVSEHAPRECTVAQDFVSLLSVNILCGDSYLLSTSSDRIILFLLFFFVFFDLGGLIYLRLHWSLFHF